jgi:hypothetical protein
MVLGIHLPRRNKVEEAEDMATPTYANTATNQIMAPTSPGDRADRREKGIDIDMIDPQEVITKLEWLSYHIEESLDDVPVTDKDGNVLYDQVPALNSIGNAIYTEVPYATPSGVVLLQRQIVLVPKMRIAKQSVQHVVERSWATSCLVLLNKVWPTIWMSQSVANNKKLLFRTLFYEIRENMSWQDKQYYGVLVDAVEALCTARLEDSKEGHKALLLKVESHRLEVSTNRNLTSNKSS